MYNKNELDKHNKINKSKIESLLGREISDAEYKDIMQSVLYQLLNEQEEF